VIVTETENGPEKESAGEEQSC